MKIMRELMREWAREERKDSSSVAAHSVFNQVLGARRALCSVGALTEEQYDKIRARTQQGGAMTAPRLRLIAGRPVSVPEEPPRDGITFFQRALSVLAIIIVVLITVAVAMLIGAAQAALVAP